MYIKMFDHFWYNQFTNVVLERAVAPCLQLLFFSHSFVICSILFMKAVDIMKTIIITFQR